jgi:L-fuconolactonase
MKIDAEVHFWKFDKSTAAPAIRNNKLLSQHYLPEQLSQSLHRNGMDGCIAVVPADSEVDTRFLAELALTHSEIRGVVGWTDLYNLKAADKLQELHQYAAIKGFRIEAAGNELPPMAVMQKIIEYQYSLDLGFKAGGSLDSWNHFIQMHSEQNFILQNSGNPDTRTAPSPVWKTMILALAGNPNVYCKTAGLLTGGIDSKTWKPADFFPFLEIIFDAFGPERLLFASDWPFLLVSGMYVQWKSLLEKFMEKFSPEDRDNFFGENANRLYRI